MIKDEIINIKLEKIQYYEGKGNLGFKMIFHLENKKVLYFNSLWLHYFDREKLSYKFNFKEYHLGISQIEKIYCFEGVGHYISLSNGNIICIYEEILDFEKFDYRYTFEIVSDECLERYEEVLNDIIELGDSDDVLQGSPKFW